MKAEVRDPALQCEGKVKYPSRKAADLVIRRIRKPESTRAYLCPHCETWHFGRMRK